MNSEDKTLPTKIMAQKNHVTHLSDTQFLASQQEVFNVALALDRRQLGLEKENHF